MFDLEGARKAGYSDAEIADHLAASRKFDVAGARKEGYSDADILTHLTKVAQPAATGQLDAAERRSNVVGQLVQGTVGGPPVTNQREAFMTPGAIPSAATGFVRGAKDVVDTGASLLSGAFGGPAAKARVDAMNAAGKAAYDLRDRNPLAASVGRIGGQLAASGPLVRAAGLAAGAVSPTLGQAINTFGANRSLPMAARIPGGAIAGGITAGAVNPDDAVMGAVTGAAFPPVADAASAVGRKLAAPVTSYATQSQKYLQRAAEALGFQLTPAARTMNPTMMRVEAGLESNPLTSGPFGRLTQANQRLINQTAAKAIGQNADNLSATILGQADDAIGRRFDAIARHRIPLTPQFEQGVRNAEQQYMSVWGSRGDTKAAGVISDALDEAQRGVMTGERYNALRSELSKVTRDAYRTGNSRLGELTKNLIDTLDDAAVAGLPQGAAQDVAAARTQWKTLLNIERSLNGENLSAAKMSNVLRREDPRGYLRGGRSSDLYTLVRAGEQFRNLTGDSGTAARLSALPIIASSGLGSSLGGLVGGPAGAVAGAAAGPFAMQGLSMAYLSPLMQKYLSRTQAPISQLAAPNASRVAPLLAPAAAGLLTQQSGQ